MVQKYHAFQIDGLYMSSNFLKKRLVSKNDLQSSVVLLRSNNLCPKLSGKSLWDTKIVLDPAVWIISLWPGPFDQEWSFTWQVYASSSPDELVLTNNRIEWRCSPGMDAKFDLGEWDSSDESTPVLSCAFGETSHGPFLMVIENYFGEEWISFNNLDRFHSCGDWIEPVIRPQDLAILYLWKWWIISGKLKRKIWNHGMKNINLIPTTFPRV